MVEDLVITYFYQHGETGRRCERDFRVSEIEAGEAKAHLAILPRYFFIGMQIALDQTGRS